MGKIQLPNCLGTNVCFRELRINLSESNREFSAFDKRMQGKGKNKELSSSIVPEITAKLPQISAVYENSILCFQICS